MMTSREDHGFPCQNPNYDKFDTIAREELSNPIEADVLVNRSDFCMMIPVDHTLVVGDLDHSLFLKTLRGSPDCITYGSTIKSVVITEPTRFYVSTWERGLQRAVSPVISRINGKATFYYSPRLPR